MTYKYEIMTFRNTTELPIQISKRILTLCNLFWQWNIQQRNMGCVVTETVSKGIHQPLSSFLLTTNCPRLSKVSAIFPKQVSPYSPLSGFMRVVTADRERQWTKPTTLWCLSLCSWDSPVHGRSSFSSSSFPLCSMWQAWWETSSLC